MCGWLLLPVFWRWLWDFPLPLILQVEDVVEEVGDKEVSQNKVSVLDAAVLKLCFDLPDLLDCPFVALAIPHGFDR